jgi:hypothetical protein
MDSFLVADYLRQERAFSSEACRPSCNTINTVTNDAGHFSTRTGLTQHVGIMLILVAKRDATQYASCWTRYHSFTSGPHSE